jgi:hypothetical protein
MSTPARNEPGALDTKRTRRDATSSRARCSGTPMGDGLCVMAEARRGGSRRRRTNRRAGLGRCESKRRPGADGARRARYQTNSHAALGGTPTHENGCVQDRACPSRRHFQRNPAGKGSRPAGWGSRGPGVERRPGAERTEGPARNEPGAHIRLIARSAMFTGSHEQPGAKRSEARARNEPGALDTKRTRRGATSRQARPSDTLMGDGLCVMAEARGAGHAGAERTEDRGEANPARRLPNEQSCRPWRHPDP